MLSLARPSLACYQNCNFVLRIAPDLTQFYAATKYILRVVIVLLEGKLLMSRHAWSTSVHERAGEFFAGSPAPFADEFIHSLVECHERCTGEER